MLTEKEIAKAFKEMDDSMRHWDIVGNKLVKPSDKVLRQRERRHDKNIKKIKILLDIADNLIIQIRSWLLFDTV